VINDDIQKFLKELPKKYQTALGFEMYKNSLKNIDFFSNKSKEMVAFVGPKLTKLNLEEGEVIYYRKDVADDSSLGA
jgi:hypothetical protein